jgi:hypothetical protein
VEGGDSSPGLAYGVNYTAGGHLRVLGAGGNLICDHDTNQTVDSSPAVGNFLGGGGIGIAFGTGSYYSGRRTPTRCSPSNANCNIVWRTNLGGTPSPARPSVTSKVTATSRWWKASTPAPAVWCTR